MSKIARKTALIFGSTAGGSQIAQFGSFAASSPTYSTDPAVIQGLSNWLTGWFAAVVGSNSPEIEDVNAMSYVFAYQLAYIMQAGIPEYDSGTIYYKGSLVNDGNGVIYISLTDANTGNALSSTTNWAFKDGGIAVNANFNVDRKCGGYLCDVSGGTITASLPAAASSLGAMVSFKNKSFGSSNLVTISPNGGDNIEGANSSFSIAAGEYVKLFCDGSAWYLWNS